MLVHPIPSHIDLEPARVAWDKRLTHYFIKSFMAANDWDPNDNEVKDHVKFQSHYQYYTFHEYLGDMVEKECWGLVPPKDVIQYHLVDEESLELASYFDNVTRYKGVYIDVGLSYDWSVSYVDGFKRICSSFDDCPISF